jgi:hypothetical protein
MNVICVSGMHTKIQTGVLHRAIQELAKNIATALTEHGRNRADLDERYRMVTTINPKPRSADHRK